MKSWKMLFLICSALFGYSASCLAAQGDEGTKVYEKSCAICHSADNMPLDKVRLTRDQWNETIDRMNALGSDVPNEKRPALLDYLVHTFGTTAPAKEGKN